MSRMNISVTDAKAQLTDLVRRAEAGEDIVLTRHGHPAVRLAPVAAKRVLSPEERMERFLAAQAEAMRVMTPGPDAAHSQDFLYDERGLPA
jgi:prevent-host-death family protein